MTSAATVVTVAVVYLVACLVIGLVPGRRQSASAEGYVAGDRALGGLLMYFITGATIFSAFAFLGAPGRAYARGAAVFHILAYGILGFLPFYFLGPRALRLGRRYGFVTQAEMVAARFGAPRIAAIMALVSTIAFVPYLAIQMQGAGIILNAMTRGAVAPWLGAALVYGVVAVYVLRSGVLGVGWTNTFQGILMMVLAWTLGLYLPSKLYGGVGAMFDRIAESRPELLAAPGLDGRGEPWTWADYSSTVLVMTIGFSAWPHLFMKAFTARDERVLRRTVVFYPTFQLFLVPLVLVGFCGVLFTSAPEMPDDVLPHLLMNVELPAVLVGLVCAGALAASMSSGDAILHASASILVRDGLRTVLGRSYEPAAERRLIRVLVVVVLIAAYVAAVTYQGTIARLLVIAYGPVTQLAPVVVATLFARRATGAGILAGLVTGIVVNVSLQLVPELQPWPLHAGLYGLCANVVALVVVSALTAAPGDGQGDEFLRVAAGGPGPEPARGAPPRGRSPEAPKMV